MIPSHKGEIPVILLLLPFISGIALGIYYFPGISIGLLMSAFAVFSLLFISLNVRYARLALYKLRWLGGALIALVLFIFGWMIAARHSELNSANHFSKFKSQYLIVQTNSEPQLKNGNIRVSASVTASINNGVATHADGTLLITIKDTVLNKYNYGDELLIPAKYTPIDPPFNPAEFNYKQYLAHKNIYYQAFLIPKQLTIIKTNTGNSLITSAISIRRNLIQKLRQNIRDTDAYAVASALILGYKADLSAGVLETYSKTGTIYVLTVSGAQVAIIYLVLAFCLSFFHRFKHGKVIAALIIIVVIWYYALLTGFTVAVTRAALMATMLIAGNTFGRYVNSLNILAASAFILLCINPWYITEAGFQLSYLAVLGVIILRPAVYNWFRFKNKIIGRLWAIISFSIAIQLAIFPLCALYFHQLPVYFLISNLFVIIPSAIVMYGGVFFLLLPKIPVVSSAAAFLVEKSAVFMNKGLSVIEHLPGAAFNKIWFATPEYLLLYAIIISVFCFAANKQVRWLRFGLICCLLLFISLGVKTIRQSNEKNIAWLSLKKHCGIVFSDGNEGIILTDLNDTDKIYRYSVQPYLDSCGIKNVKIYGLNANINSPWLKKNAGLIQFLNLKAFILDGELAENALSPKLNINYLYITGNPNMEINALNTNFRHGMVMIDGSNSDKKIGDWGKQLSISGFQYKILKRNKSFLTVSN